MTTSNRVSTFFRSSPLASISTSTSINNVFKLRVKLVLQAVNIRFTKSHHTSASASTSTTVTRTASPPGPSPVVFESVPSKGDVLANRYILIRQLGKGGFSTVWLARDNSSATDVAIKIPTKRMRSTQEVDRLRLIGPASRVPPQLTRMLDDFPFHPTHTLLTTCIVLALHGPTVDELKSHLGTRRLPEAVVRRLTHDVLTALAFLHNLNLAHTDIQPRNILLSQTDAFTRCALDEWRFVLADLGHAVRLPHTLREPASPNIQPHALRAPEVILGQSWDCKVDIWNLGCLVYEFIVGAPLFNPFFTAEGYEGMTPAMVHLLQIVEQVGEPPLHVRLQTPEYFQVVEESARLRCPFALQRVSLKALVGLVWKEPEEVRKFVEFLRELLCVDPEARSSARRLLFHSWICV